MSNLNATYNLNHKGFQEGTSLLFIVEGATPERMRELWGAPGDLGFDEDGYGDIYRLTGPDGELLTLYTRFGVWRIGGQGLEEAERFAKYLVQAGVVRGYRQW